MKVLQTITAIIQHSIKKSLPSSKHCIMFPPNDKQSTGGWGKTPRHNDIHLAGTPRLLQQDV